MRFSRGSVLRGSTEWLKFIDDGCCAAGPDSGPDRTTDSAQMAPLSDTITTGNDQLPVPPGRTDTLLTVNSPPFQLTITANYQQL